MQVGNERYGITRKLTLRALHTAVSLLHKIAMYSDLGAKVRSEIVSGVIEKELAKSLTKKMRFPVNAPKSDNEPDLFYTKFPEGENSVEIKVAYMPGGTGAWRTGDFGKREGPYLLIARAEDPPQAYVVLLNMSDGDWVSPKNHRTKEQNYYAKTVSKKELIKRRDRIELVGNLERGKKKDGTPSNRIKMNMEPIRGSLQELLSQINPFKMVRSQNKLYFEEE